MAAKAFRHFAATKGKPGEWMGPFVVEYEVRVQKFVEGPIQVHEDALESVK